LNGIKITTDKLYLKKYSLLFLCIVFSVPSCKKYPEDSKSPHLETVKWRLAGGVIKGDKNWNNTGRYNIINNQDLGPVWQGANWWAIRFARNGHFSGQMDPFVSYGYLGARWELIAEKEMVKITTENGIVSEYKIMKLDNNALWLQNDSLLYKFKPHKKKD